MIAAHTLIAGVWKLRLRCAGVGRDAENECDKIRSISTANKLKRGHFMSFNYTPPPDEVIRNGQIASYVLYASLSFVPNVKVGAAIGGLGSAIIAWKVASYAGGDMGSLSQVINPPIQAVVGALIGAFISFISKSILRFFRKEQHTENTPTEQPEQNDP